MHCREIKAIGYCDSIENQKPLTNFVFVGVFILHLDVLFRGNTLFLTLKVTFNVKKSVYECRIG